MIETKPDIKITKSEEFKTANFSVAEGQEAHIFGILRSSLYSDKLLACIREYTTNAQDAHIIAQKPNEPVNITLPSVYDSNLRIRDYGLGLDESGIWDVFCKYGASTKRESNSFVGFMGIGSKSGFSYTDAFTIVSVNNGTKYMYGAYIDETQLGAVSLISSTPTSDPSGLEIIIPIRNNDIVLTRNKVIEFAKYFEPKPIVNGEVTVNQTAYAYISKSGKFKVEKSSWTSNSKIVMGNIAYPFNPASAANKMSGPQCAVFSGSVSKFEIGDLDVSASRETLQYTDRTINALKQFADTEIEFAKQFVAELYAGCTTYMQSLNKYIKFQDRTLQTLFNGIGAALNVWNGQTLGISMGLKGTAISARSVISRDPIKLHTEYHLTLNPEACEYFINDTSQYISRVLTANSDPKLKTYVLDFKDETAIQNFERDFSELKLKRISSFKDDLSEIVSPIRQRHKVLRYAPKLASTNADHWIEEEIDLSKGGIFVPMFRNKTKFNSKYLGNVEIPPRLFDYIAVTIWPTNQPAIYGVKEAWVPQLNKQGSGWRNVSELFDVFLDAVPQQDLQNIFQIYRYNKALKPHNYSTIQLLMKRDELRSVREGQLESDFVSLNSLATQPTNTTLLDTIQKLGVNIDHYMQRRGITIDIQQTIDQFYSKYPLIKHVTSYTDEQQTNITDYINLKYNASQENL